jgi:hypothetical protein
MDSLIPYPFQLESNRTIDLGRTIGSLTVYTPCGRWGASCGGGGCSVIIANSQAVGTIKRNPIWKVNTRPGCIFVGCGCMRDPGAQRGHTACSARVGSVSMVGVRWSNKLQSPRRDYPALIGTTHAVSVAVDDKLAGGGNVLLMLERWAGHVACMSDWRNL